ncbi:MAG: TadE/TadG family type IV pilus assembly protein [Thermovenabulum sp.]|uniref:TadE/TadG family type IV pilus assembly protein n=1 Tax=Thermovenabulum sp. TaxID=3100335 RepID=UPI003C7A8C2D
MDYIRKIIKSKRGNAIIETTIMFMILIMLTVGYMYFTQLVRESTVLQVAARESARAYAVTGDYSFAYNKAINELKLGGIDPNRAKINIYTKGNERVARIQLNKRLIIPFAGEYRITIGGGADFKKEFQ